MGCDALRAKRASPCRCNILALVASSNNTRWTVNKARAALRLRSSAQLPKPSPPPCAQVMIWDDHQGRCIGELTFRNQVRLPPLLPVGPPLMCPSAERGSVQVRAVRLRRDRIAVALEHKARVAGLVGGVASAAACALPARALTPSTRRCWSTTSRTCAWCTSGSACTTRGGCSRCRRWSTLLCLPARGCMSARRGRVGGAGKSWQVTACE